MEIFLIKAAQLILSLSILVVVHEFGHFIFARWFKVRVEKFYLFFDPWFCLFRFKPKDGDTEYGVGWLPLGGYCKISGMIDESMDKTAMALPPQPWEFRSKRVGPRLLIMTAGVIFNFLLAIFIYSMVLYNFGDRYIPLQKVTLGMQYSSTFKDVGFEDGDILLSADNEPLERLDEECLRAIINSQTVTVLRNGAEQNIAIPEDIMQRLLVGKDGFATYRIPFRISQVTSASAREAGLKDNDRVVSINGVPAVTVNEVKEQLYAERGNTLRFEVQNGAVSRVLNIPVDEAGHIGVALLYEPKNFYPTVVRAYSFFESFPAGVSLGVRTLGGYINDMKHVFTKEGAQSLGGFGAIGNLFPELWNWELFWLRTAFLSIILAFMNILPIPALDGGHVMFLFYEIIAGRKPGDKFLEYAQIAGMTILFALLLYANGNDLFRFFSN